MFCTKCGSEIKEGQQFCTNCGEPVESIGEESAVEPTPEPVAEVAAQPEHTAKKSKAPVIIAIACILILFLAAFLILVGYDLVKTKEFKECMAEYEEVEANYAGLGKYKSEYEEIGEDASEAASHLAFWKYEDLAEQMENLESEIRQMNEAVAEYREVFDKCVKQIETDGRYAFYDMEEEYNAIKKELEEALNDFDEKSCKKEAKDFAELCDEIVETNEKKASQAITDANNIKDSFSGSGTHAFERYMINTLASRLETDKKEQNFLQLEEDYAQLKNWSDKFYGAMQSGEQIGNFVQADVSATDQVKLYFSPKNYEDYNFKLEDFIIYEENNNVWEECKAVDMSQIKGALTMDLVVDVSGSMRDDFVTMQNAVEGFVNSTHSDTALGLSTIGSIYERYQEFTLDKDRIVQSAWDLECYGLTSLYQSLYSSVVYTASAEGARCVVAFTDGHNEPYGSGYDYNAQDVIDVSTYYQVPVYIIGIGSGVYSSELREIAEATGGAYYDHISIYNLQNVYSNIYEAQGRVYQLTYKTNVSNRTNRDIYVLYADDSQKLSVRLESELNASALSSAYETASFTAQDLSSFYTDSKYLSSDNLAKLGDDLEAVQTIINIYYAKNGYRFGDGENGQKQLAKMISLGVISENGTLDGDTVSAIIKSNPVVYQNFSALYNYRYELVYTVAYDIYMNQPSISYEDLRKGVHDHYGEENEKRFDPVTKAAWNAIKAGK